MFLDCVQYLLTKPKSSLNKENITTVIARLRRVHFVRNWSRKKCACATGKLSEQDRFRYEVLYKGMTIHEVIEQIQSPIKNDSEKH